MRDSFVRTLLSIAKTDPNVHLLTGDLGYGVLKPFFEELPDQFTNIGIAEQNMTGFAAGMALEGKIVFTYSIGNFPTLRCLEQIRNDCAYHNANVKIVSVGGGLAYGALGMSHHATEDLAVMRALPGVTVLAPGDSLEAEYATRAIYLREGTCYLRLGRGGEPQLHDTLKNFQIGKAIKLKDGKDLVIFTTGAIIDEVMGAERLLCNHGLKPCIYTFPTVKPIDTEVIKQCSSQYDYIITVEEHNKIGGFGSAVAEVLAELADRRARILRIGMDDQYLSIVGTQSFLRDYCELSAAKIFKKIIDTVYGNLQTS